MNKQEKLFAFMLALGLIGWMGWSYYQQRNAPPPPAVPQSVAVAATPASITPATPSVATPTIEVPVAPAVPATPEQRVTLGDDEMTIALSSWGAAIQRVTLSQFATQPGKIAEDNPAMTLDFSAAPLLGLAHVPGMPANVAFTVLSNDATSATFRASAGALTLTRSIRLEKDYRLSVRDTFSNTASDAVMMPATAMNLGAMQMGESSNDILSFDSLPATEKSKTKHWDGEKQTKAFLAVAGSFGCGGSKSAAGMPQDSVVTIAESQTWIAMKSRFFVTAFTSPTTNTGFTAVMTRDLGKQNYALRAISGTVQFPALALPSGTETTRDYTLYIGPKKMSLLNKLDMGDIMQFGFFAWFCKLLVPTLNFFYSIIPNYGIAIILLTFLVRIIFWPLTHKSTLSMRKMQEIQPKIKEVQAKFKDNPQKLQQETWALYRENKVNPLSSCLPMLIQIPVFIALFTVLRSAVELRYAPFLWISDLSEPENLFAGMLPVAINILPILMAATMALQSWLTPSAGDPKQQRMMMVMMPIMMLVMFYSFPSALSLYWTVSQVLSIVQMWWIRKRYSTPVAVCAPENDRPLTRQQRRHGGTH